MKPENKPRNFVAKNDFNVAAVHEDKKSKQQQSLRKQKHKGKGYEFC
ncbi:hypothetical protein CPT_Muldoon_250 [Serratia phage Muldoon]|uniref:Uncharacterized protein n=1 Tax=Serratia phage Muldoon TaxID=2601678 RepID=A0A5P8PHN1_9CAUD|nr:hypothetical protein HYP94_gp140 [Serratia phage Muldoon]QFR56201.1 hypothetical protein CPT_Muldoon_250 [Serratia phage Muldoon]UNA02356.1 hypothetical protein [Serratia phage SP1]